jgi:hypothetical protein
MVALSSSTTVLATGRTDEQKKRTNQKKRTSMIANHAGRTDEQIKRTSQKKRTSMIARTAAKKGNTRQRE